MVPSLLDLFGVCIPVGGLLGGLCGFAVRAPTARDLVANVTSGATLGGLAGTAVGLAIWLGGTAAGG